MLIIIFSEMYRNQHNFYVKPNFSIYQTLKVEKISLQNIQADAAYKFDQSFYIKCGIKPSKAKGSREEKNTRFFCIFSTEWAKTYLRIVILENHSLGKTTFSFFAIEIICLLFKLIYILLCYLKQNLSKSKGPKNKYQEITYSYE